MTTDMRECQIAVPGSTATTVEEADVRSALEAEIRRLRERGEQMDLKISHLSRKLERVTDTLSYRLGYALIHSSKSWSQLKALPGILRGLQEEARERRGEARSRSTIALAAQQLVRGARRTSAESGARAGDGAARAGSPNPGVSPVPAALPAVAELPRRASQQGRENKGPRALLSDHIRNLRVYIDRETMLAELFPTGGKVAEMGVDRGDFSRSILEIASPEELNLIDPWDTSRYGGDKCEAVTARFQREVRSGQVRVHRGYSTDVLAGFPDGYFDWVYIDTTHAYSLTARELALSQRKVRAGGIIAGHDYTSGNVDKRLRYGVVEAVHEFCHDARWEMIGLTHEPHRYLSFALRAMAIKR